MRESMVDGKEVIISLPWSLNRQQSNTIDQPKTWEKGVITRVPIDIPTEEIKAETGAIWVHRITKRVTAGYEPTTAVIIAFKTGLRNTVNISFTRHRVTVYIPTPTRCNKRQKYGHKLDQCTRKEPRCSRCGQTHEYSACTTTSDRAK